MFLVKEIFFFLFRKISFAFFLAPPLVQQKMQDFEISRGQEVTITVTADGSPLPTCTWFHNDKPVQIQPDRIIVTNDGSTHTLKILNVELTDDGQYKVRENLRFVFVKNLFNILLKAVIENQMGKTELVSQVTVMGK